MKKNMKFVFVFCILMIVTGIYSYGYWRDKLEVGLSVNVLYPVEIVVQESEEESEEEPELEEQEHQPEKQEQEKEMRETEADTVETKGEPQWIGAELTGFTA